MSSELPDELTKVWQQQPTPAPTRSAEAILAEVRDAEHAWNEEWTTVDRGYAWMLGVCAFPVIVDFLRGHGVDWPNFCLTLVWAWWCGWVAWFRYRQRHIDRAGDLALLDRLSKARALLRDRLRVQRLQLISLPLVAFAVGAMTIELAHLLWLEIAVAGATVVGLAWLAAHQWRKNRMHLARKLDLIERLTMELKGEEDDRP